MNAKAAKLVRENTFAKTRPNKTAQYFCQLVNQDLPPSSQLPSHREYHYTLQFAGSNHLEFKPVSYCKGVYIDGREREDVVKHWEKYLHTMATL